MHPAEGQRFLRHAFPWCTALWQLLRPVNTPVTDVIMALLRYRTTRSFCWTKTSLSPRCPVDPDTTPAGSDVTFVWAGVQLTFYVPGGGGGRGGVEGGTEGHVLLGEQRRGCYNETRTVYNQHPKHATPGHPVSKRPPNRLDVWTQRTTLFNALSSCWCLWTFAIYVLPGISMCIFNLISEIQEGWWLKHPCTRECCQHFAASGIKISAAAIEHRFGEHGSFNEVNYCCWSTKTLISTSAIAVYCS